MQGDLCFSDGKIVEIGTGLRGETEIDARGLLLAPALIDVHGDAFDVHQGSGHGGIANGPSGCHGFHESS